MYLTEFVLLAILAVFMVAVRERLTSGLAVWLMVPVAFLVFSLRQWENMLWGFYVAFVLPLAAAFVAFLWLARMKSERFVPLVIGAMLSATVASFSAAQGLMVWPIGLGQLLIAPLSKWRKFVVATLWSAVGVTQWWLYSIGYATPAHHPPMRFSWSYLLVGLGAALFDGLKAARVAGLAVLILAVATVPRGDSQAASLRQSFWLAVIAYVLVTLCAITIGRSGFGVNQALSSRYATLTIPLVIASYVLAIPRGSDRLRLVGVFLASATLTLAIVGTAGCFTRGFQLGRSVWSLRVCGQTTVCTIGSQSETAQRSVYDHELLHTSAKTLVDAVAVMAKLKYNVFADSELCAVANCRRPRSP